MSLSAITRQSRLSSILTQQARSFASQPSTSTSSSSSATSTPANPSILSQNKSSSGFNVASKSSSTNPGDPTKPSHFKITLHRSAIGLPKRYRETITSLGIHRRGQTVFQLHSPSVAGKILRLKELVKVENVTSDQVKTKREMKLERRAVRGYIIKQKFRQAGATSSTSWMDNL
ncbi:hypothetical protein CPB86DRAFT_811942 [Serendipita vermifera]|nr:hypothetical protein CPB86DRAFT_811942 [Serendipita vermifera]